MMKNKNKTRIILLIYTLCLTILIIGLTLAFSQQLLLSRTTYIPSVLLIPDEQEISETLTSNDNLVELFSQTSGMISLESINKQYQDNLYKKLPIIIFVLIIIIALGTWVLWHFIKKENNRQAHNLAMKLDGIESNNTVVHEDYWVNHAYEDIKEKMVDYQNDYLKLSSYISHEQKNILSKLKAKVEVTGDDAIKEIDELANSLDDILTLSATKKSEGLEVVDVAYICASICDGYKHIHPNIYFTFEEEQSLMVRANERWLLRAVSNLVDNAIKYGLGSDVIVSVGSKKGSVIIQVADKGIGISKEEQSKIIENRYRINQLKKDGYGIGLSLVNHVCDLCNGYFWIESEKNSGSNFYMVFEQALTLD